MSIDTTKLTPLMQQYFAIKSNYADSLLLFQVGDFYELFFDDAKAAASFLGIALTKRGTYNGDPIPLCGVPLHALDHYLVKLVKGGFKLAIVDQLEEAKPGKVVDRGVTRVLTPGTLTDSQLLDEKSASYLMSFFPLENSWGLVFGELLSAQLFATVLPVASERQLEAELARFFPDEVLIPRTTLGKSFQGLFNKAGYYTTLQESEEGDKDSSAQWIAQQFKDESRQLLEKHEALALAFKTFYAYMKRNQLASLEQFKSFTFYQPEDFLILDPATQRNLELVKNSINGTHKNTLFAHMDRAVTPMGSRMIKKWLVRPLVKRQAIEQRLEVVKKLVDDHQLMHRLKELLVEIGDIERIVGRIALRRGPIHDYIHLGTALAVMPDIIEVMKYHKNQPLLAIIAGHLGAFESLHQLLTDAINDDPNQDWIIKAGYDENLDELRELVNNSNQKVLELEAREIAATGINSLKIRYNAVHGYYIEITKANFDLVPDRFIRQQTLVGRERYTTPELRILQEEIYRARNTITSVEKEIFERVKKEVESHIHALRKTAYALAHLDGLLGFARLAYEYGYVMPQFNEERNICIIGGRHPVVEVTMSSSFIPNDTNLTNDQSLWVITGPNMGGKSTYLRQVALICIMAQCGSFVPAHQADLALLDRIFTRIGSGDNLAGGKSTFLVEMEETALICTQATERSLVILDEVGRGTSTYDGLAIAQAVVEYIFTHVGARCLFATHYHELTQLQERYAGIKSYYAASTKTTHGIVFLYKIVAGVADGSFGLEVAKLAQLPNSLVARAQEILQDLTVTGHDGVASRVPAAPIYPAQRIDDSLLVAENARLKDQVQASKEALKSQERMIALLKSIDYNELSPKKAFDLLWQIKGDG